MSSLSDLTTSTADPGVEARYWRSSDDGAISCELCPRACRVIPGGLGFCAVRKNEGDRLISLSYGRPVALQVDPIEKKPLLEFLPGTKTFSIGAFGCNLDCSFCQNHHLSRGSYEEADIREFRGFTSPKEIVRMAKESGCESIAFTYNEPIVWCEYWADIAKLARSANLATVLVSNAYMSEVPAKELLPLIDAANFDMKGFSEDFYKRMTGGTLADVLRTIKTYHSTNGHLELTNLVIPGENDSPEMVESYLEWVAANIGFSVPLHFSAYFPKHRYLTAPPTPRNTLERIRSIAVSAGFSSVYLGNV